MKKMLAKDYKEKYLNDVKSIVGAYESTFEIKPSLVCIQVGDNPDSNLYVSMKRKAIESIGANFIYDKIEALPEENKIQFLIDRINNSIDKSVQGLMIQLPIPGLTKEETEYVLNNIDKDIDVDGLSAYNRCFISDKHLSKNIYVPCTAKGIMSLLKFHNVTLAGKNVTIIGRSVEVGKPLVDLCIRDNATVTCIHSFTPMSCRIDILKHSDIVISAAGCARHIKPEYLKEGVVIVDAGVTVIDGKSIGDFDEACYEKASLYTPYVGAVGPMTIMTLLENFSESCSREIVNEYSYEYEI